MNSLGQYIGTGGCLGFISGVGYGIAAIPIKSNGQNHVPDVKTLTLAIFTSGVFSALSGAALGALSYYTNGYVVAGALLGVAAGGGLNESYYKVDNIARRAIGCGIVGASLGYAASLL